MDPWRSRSTLRLLNKMTFPRALRGVYERKSDCACVYWLYFDVGSNCWMSQRLCQTRAETEPVRLNRRRIGEPKLRQIHDWFWRPVRGLVVNHDIGVEPAANVPTPGNARKARRNCTDDGV
jgi:hypothetical protein